MCIFIIVIWLKSVCEINFFLFQDPKEAGSDDEEANLDEDEINKRFVLYSKDWINECFFGCFMLCLSAFLTKMFGLVKSDSGLFKFP